MEIILLALFYLVSLLFISAGVLFVTAKIFKRPISFAFAFVLTIIFSLAIVIGQSLALLADTSVLRAFVIGLMIFLGGFIFVHLIRKKYSYTTGISVGILIVSQAVVAILTFAMTILFGLAFFAAGNVAQTYEVSGHSMAPTLEEGDQFVINKRIDGIDDIERGDIVVFESNLHGRDFPHVKRAVGLPGDRVVLKDGELTVYLADTSEVFRPYGDQTVPGQDAETIVSPGSLYVVGDNLSPGSSLDSTNMLGLVSVEDVVGVYWFAY